jgi:RNA polymerase sigma-70 factor, ECF subfamily
MAQREIQHIVEQAIDNLPEPYRIVFIARVIEKMSVEETAAVFALRPETVKTRALGGSCVTSWRRKLARF